MSASEALAIFLNSYETACGRPAKRIGREWRMLCPSHELDGSSHNPSLAIWARPDGSVAFHCMSGLCSHGMVAARLKSLGVHVMVPNTAQREAYKAQHEIDRQRKLQEAQAIYEASRSIMSIDPVWIYFKRRYISPTSDEVRFLRTNRDGSELIGLLSQPSTLLDHTILLRGVSTLRINPDGSAKTNDSGKKWRQITGLLKGNGVVLGRWSEDVVLGEGIETTLAAMRLLRRTFGIAALSASNMENVEPPAGVRHIWVAKDNDSGGEDAARRVVERRRSQGFDVTVACWGRRGDDAADEWRRRNEYDDNTGNVRD